MKVSPVEFDRIDSEHLAYFEPKKVQKIYFLKIYYATFYCRPYNIFKKKKEKKMPIKHKKHPPKLLYGPIFFSIVNWPKISPNHILYSVTYK